MVGISFDEIWNQIMKHEGETFKTKTGKEFTYKISGDGLITSRTDYKLSKTDFKKAYEMMPINGPGEIRNIIRGSAYIWAILTSENVYRNRGSI